MTKPRTVSGRTARIAIALGGALFLGGCAGVGQQQQMEAFSAHWVDGDYQAAAQVTGGQPGSVSESEINQLSLFELLHFAEASRLLGNDEVAVQAFDRTEEWFRRFDEQTLAAVAAQQVSAVLVNDTVMEYRGYLYEAILANSYKGLSFLSMGNAELARVEFNRADERTRRALAYFADELEAEQRALAQEEGRREQAQAVQASMRNPNTQQALRQAYGDPNRWAAYPDFVNPFATHLHGLHFMASSASSQDIERAVNSFERVAGMTGNAVAAADQELAEQIASGALQRDALPGLVWVVYENGVGPHLVEDRIDLPLVLITGGQRGTPYYTGIALPRLTGGQSASAAITVSDGADNQVRTGQLAEMERVMNTEFKARFNGILFRSMTSAVVKMYMQAAISEEFGDVGGLLSGIVAAATTQADTRSWRALPNEWQIARLQQPADGVLSVSGLSGGQLQIKMPDWPMTMVYIKQPSAVATPIVRLIDLSGRNRAINPMLDRQVAGGSQ